MSRKLQTLLRFSPLRFAVYGVLVTSIIITFAFFSPSRSEYEMIPFAFLTAFNMLNIFIWLPLGIASVIMNILAIVNLNRGRRISGFLLAHLFCMCGYEVFSGFQLLSLFVSGSILVMVETLLFCLAEIGYTVLLIFIIKGQRQLSYENNKET